MSVGTTTESGMSSAEPAPLEMREFLDFVLEASRALLECGCSSNRIEHLIGLLGDAFGFDVETLAIPTGVWITVRKDGTNMVDLVRVHEWTVDLDRLARLSDLIDSIHGRHISIGEAQRRLEGEVSRSHPYPLWLTILAGGGASSVLIFFYGGSPIETAAAFPGGALVQVIQKTLSRTETGRYLADFVSAAVVALYAFGCTALFPTIDMPRLIVAAIIVIIPGLLLVNAVHEVAQKNLVSGSAKLLDAMVVTAALSCGVLFALGALHFLRAWGV